MVSGNPRKRGRAKKSAGRAKKTKPIRNTRKIKKQARKSPKKIKPVAPKKQTKTFVGTVEHFFTEISVGVIFLKKPLKAGDTVSIEGATTNFKQKVESMQIDRKPVQEGRKGQSIGMKVKSRVREKDKVFLVK